MAAGFRERCGRRATTVTQFLRGVLFTDTRPEPSATWGPRRAARPCHLDQPTSIPKSIGRGCSGDRMGKGTTKGTRNRSSQSAKTAGSTRLRPSGGSSFPRVGGLMATDLAPLQKTRKGGGRQESWLRLRGRPAGASAGRRGRGASTRNVGLEGAKGGGRTRRWGGWPSGGPHMESSPRLQDWEEGAAARSSTLEGENRRGQ